MAQGSLGHVGPIGGTPASQGLSEVSRKGTQVRKKDKGGRWLQTSPYQLCIVSLCFCYPRAVTADWESHHLQDPLWKTEPLCGDNCDLWTQDVSSSAGSHSWSCRCTRSMEVPVSKGSCSSHPGSGSLNTTSVCFPSPQKLQDESTPPSAGIFLGTHRVSLPAGFRAGQGWPYDPWGYGEGEFRVQ